MIFYRVNKSSFKFLLIVAIVSWIPTILLLTKWRFKFGIEISFCSLLFSILAIFSYFSCYVNNIKYEPILHNCNGNLSILRLISPNI